MEFNSVLVHKYETGLDYIPPHSDNEQGIVPDSSIVTISIGDTRTMKFREKCTKTFAITELSLHHGEVMVMSRRSQDCYDHQIAPEADRGARISFTFRQLRDTRQQRPSAAATKHKILVLTDSRNESFDSNEFKNSLVCFTEPMYYLKDLVDHKQQIGEARCVLISSGLNDIIKHNATPDILAEHMTHFVSRAKKLHPNTTILYESVGPLALRADPTGYYNRVINDHNRRMFQLSLKSDNFKLFDTLELGLAHLSRDGIHLTDSGKLVVSKSWVNAVLIQLGYRRGPLCIRKEFRDRFDYERTRGWG